MRLFQRIGDIIAANLNDLVDRFEDPEVMLKQAIREMETMIEDATGGAARAIAGERILARDLAGHEQKGATWRARAEEAVVRGDDDLARQAIARAHEHEVMAQALVGQRASAEKTSQALRGQVAAMRAKQAEARRKLESLSARRQVAQTACDLHAQRGRKDGEIESLEYAATLFLAPAAHTGPQNRKRAGEAGKTAKDAAGKSD